MPQKYRLTYHNGRTQVFEADKYGAYGDNWVFTSGNREVLSVTRKDLESIALADAVPEAELPEVEVSEVQRSGRGHGFN
jgi:hypothetical protein